MFFSLDSMPDSTTWDLVLRSFLMGLRFDLVIVSHVMIVVTLFWFLNLYINSSLLDRANTFFLKLMFLFLYLLTSIDIPYFVFHSIRLNKLVFEWFTATPGFVLKMGISEPMYWVGAIVPFAITSFLFIYTLNQKIIKSAPSVSIVGGVKKRWLFVWFVPVCFLFLVGARGRLSHKSPIRTGTAFFSQNSYVNLIALNPVFTLVNSYKHKESAELFNSKEALLNVKRAFGVGSASDFKRNVVFGDQTSAKKNVVLVIMESMAAKKTGFLNGKKLTPEIDKLSKVSLSFNHAYTVGIHTFNGLFSTLFSRPTSFGEHPLKAFPMPKLDGLASALSAHGYSTNFFVTCDPEFDNMSGYLTHNGFQNVFGQSFFSKDKVVSTLGVPDHVMFEESIPYINRLKEPFFVTYLTTSDHGPYVVPSGIPFVPKATNEKDRTTEYADWSIGYFLEQAKKQDWFRDTLFVFIADHGSPIDSVYDISLEYHHTPLFFYSPDFVKAETRLDLASQMDVYPTVMSFLKLPYSTSSFGVDLLTQKRTFVPINSDEVLGALSDHYLYVFRRDGQEALYEWRQSNTEDVSPLKQREFQELRINALSTFQASQDLIRNSVEPQAKRLGH